MMNMGIHTEGAVRVVRHYIQNANSITLAIGEEGLELTLYDLSEDKTDALMAAFADEETIIYTDKPGEEA